MYFKGNGNRERYIKYRAEHVVLVIANTQQSMQSQLQKIHLYIYNIKTENVFTGIEHTEQSMQSWLEKIKNIAFSHGFRKHAVVAIGNTVISMQSWLSKIQRRILSDGYRKYRAKYVVMLQSSACKQGYKYRAEHVQTGLEKNRAEHIYSRIQIIQSKACNHCKQNRACSHKHAIMLLEITQQRMWTRVQKIRSRTCSHCYIKYRSEHAVRENKEHRNKSQLLKTCSHSHNKYRTSIYTQVSKIQRITLVIENAEPSIQL